MARRSAATFLLDALRGSTYPPPRGTPQRTRWFIAAAVEVVSLAFFVVLGMHTVARQVTTTSGSRSLDFMFRALGASCIFLAANYLRRLQLTAPTTFGLLQLAFGLATAWYVIELLPASGATAWIAVLGAIYLLVEGLKSFEEAAPRVQGDAAAAARTTIPRAD